ncbi:hypothetical protein DMP16_10740, partial [Sulfolobus sp. B1]
MAANNPLYNMVCQPVGLGTKMIQIPITSSLDMRRLSKDLKLLLRSQGYTVYATYGENVLILQIHAVGIRGHYYTVKICQNNNVVLLEAGITNGRVQLEEAGISAGIG